MTASEQQAAGTRVYKDIINIDRSYGDISTVLDASVDAAN